MKHIKTYFYQSFNENTYAMKCIFSDVTRNLIFFQSIGWDGGIWRPSAQSCMQPCSHTSTFIPQDHKLTQDSLLSNLDFLQYNQILHSLKDQWWAFNLILCWTSGPILSACRYVHYSNTMHKFRIPY